MRCSDEVVDLIRSLKAESPAERWQAAASLAVAARQDQPGVVAALAEALGDEHAFVRWHAGVALARAGSQAGRAALYRVLSEGSPLGQAAAADAISHLRNPDPGPLLRALDSPQPSVRQSALETLIRLRERKVAERLPDLLRDPSPGVRRAAAGAMAYLGDDRVLGALMERLEDDSPLVRSSAAYALGARRARAAQSALLARVEDPDPAVRRNVVWALGRLGEAAALPQLLQLSNDPALDGQVAREARQAINAIACRGWRRLGCMLRRSTVEPVAGGSLNE